MTDTAEHLETWLPKEKPCSGCGDWLPRAPFPLNRRMYLGRGSRCRECAREATRDWRKRNRDEINAERRERPSRAPSSRAWVLARASVKRAPPAAAPPWGSEG